MYQQNIKNTIQLFIMQNLRLFQNFILMVRYQINFFIKITLSYYIQFHIRIISHLQSAYREH